jgi:hypothetical protein
MPLRLTIFVGLEPVILFGVLQVKGRAGRDGIIRGEIGLIEKRRGEQDGGRGGSGRSKRGEGSRMEGEEDRVEMGEFSRGLEHPSEFHPLHGIHITPKAEEGLLGGGWKRQGGRGRAEEAFHASEEGTICSMRQRGKMQTP